MVQSPTQSNHKQRFCKKPSIFVPKPGENPEERLDKRAIYGFFAHDVNGLELNHFKLTWNEQNPENKWLNSAVFENINGLNRHEVSVDSVPQKKEPAVIFKNVSPK